jgi:biotin transport system substrate-specific component
VAADLSWSTAIHDGFAIFVVGGIVKAIVGAVAVPAAWRGVRAVDGAPRHR